VNASIKHEGRLGQAALRRLRLRASYIALAVFAKAFAGPFWFFEGRRWRLADRLENERLAR
jgi:hypothetical protein